MSPLTILLIWGIAFLAALLAGVYLLHKALERWERKR